MKTYEELKAMATEDLVRYAMETQEELAANRKSSSVYRIGSHPLRTNHTGSTECCMKRSRRRNYER